MLDLRSRSLRSRAGRFESSTAARIGSVASKRAGGTQSSPTPRSVSPTPTICSPPLPWLGAHLSDRLRQLGGGLRKSRRPARRQRLPGPLTDFAVKASTLLAAHVERMLISGRAVQLPQRRLGCTTMLLIHARYTHPHTHGYASRGGINEFSSSGSREPGM